MEIQWNKVTWYSWTLAAIVFIGIFFWAGWLCRELHQIDTLYQSAQNSEFTSQIAGWKTYKNEEYGFEFKYPANWNIENNDGTNNHELWISFNDSKYGTMNLEDVTFDRPTDFDTLEKIYQAMISNREYLPVKDSSAVLKDQNGTNVLMAKKTDFILLTSAPAENILFFKTQSGKIIMLDTYSDDKLTDQIFNSFQQIQNNSSASTDIANWKTYTNQKYSISFKYPASWGDVKEDFYDSSQEKNITEATTRGKDFSLSFTTKGIAPSIDLVSSDYSFYDGWTFTGQIPLSDVYKHTADYKTEPVYFDLGGVNAVRFVTTNTTSGYDPSIDEEAYAALENKTFSAVDVFEFLSSKVLTVDEAKGFIKSVENHSADPALQKAIDEFNLFLTTFKFTN